MASKFPAIFKLGDTRKTLGFVWGWTKVGDGYAFFWWPRRVVVTQEFCLDSCNRPCWFEKRRDWPEERAKLPSATLVKG